MNPQTFFDHFERLVDAPNAVARLREMILQLAVQGKLVEQDERDEPASILLEKIKAEKMRLVKEKKISVDESLPTIEGDNEPFRLPNGWQWVHLNQITNAVHYGYTASANHSLKDVRLLRITDIQNGKVEWDSVPGCEIDKDKINGVELREGDLLIARTGGTIGKSFLVENVSVRAVFASYLIRAVPNKFLFPKYVKLFLESELYWQQLYAKSMGTGQPNVNATSLKSLFVPLPPFEEQKRIVAKVDELMRLCGVLEQEQAERRISRLHINHAALDQLLTARDAVEFSTCWQTVCDHFTTLTATTDSIGKLRQSVLQLAVLGKLTRQDPQNESATSLLRRIRAEKERLVKEKKIKAVKPLPLVSKGEVPFDIPDSWKWVRLQEVLLKITDGTHHSPLNTLTGDYKYITAKNIRQDKIDLTNVSYVSAKVHEEIYSRCNPEQGDVLYIKDGATTGVVAVNNLEEPFSMLSSVALLKCPSCLYNRYLFYVLSSPYFYSTMRDGMTGVAITRVTIAKLSNAIIPLPPLEEQKRIVVAVNRLMALCDELEANLRRAEEDGERLLRAAVRSLLASVSENSAAEAAALVVQ